MKVLRISLTDGEAGPYDGATYRTDPNPHRFWDRWNGPMAGPYWHRTELDRDGNPYTVKWHSHAFRNGRGARVELTTALEADGRHPANTQPPPVTSVYAQPIPATHRGRLHTGERLRSPHGSWTVADSWIANSPGAQDDDRDYRSTLVIGTYTHVYYLLTHEGGHQEEWSAPAMTAAGFHRV